MGCFEIGSEFWEDTIPIQGKSICWNERKRCFLCGRTALDYIVRDAKLNGTWNSILLPSYCCETMIEPFLKNGINVRFYTVKPSECGLEYVLPEPKTHEAIYIMQYFGFIQKDECFEKRVDDWDFCILDATHNCFSVTQGFENVSNIKYVYASYRKWANIPGLAIAEKLCEDFLLPPSTTICEEYVNFRNRACAEKKKYMNTKQGNKAEFLQLFREAEEILQYRYENFAAAPEAIFAYENLDVEIIRKMRRKNADYLIRELSKQKRVRLIFTELKENDCPLFVPILLERECRDNLKRYLIKNDIYCPVHWPVTNSHGRMRKEECELYQNELSLVCDQRYGEADMQRIVSVINDFFDNYSIGGKV